jgi:hypothetical protein
MFVREWRDCIIRQTRFGPRDSHSSFNKLVRSPPRVASPKGPMLLNALQFVSDEQILRPLSHTFRHFDEGKT